jgi:S-adenosyl-L-methionine hydrolase (adenosine-forming)
MIVIFTDFGPGPYTAQMRAVLARDAPSETVIELMADAPRFAPRPAAYLLAALAPVFPHDAVFLCVVDPGVGGNRPPVVAEAGGQRFVGPGNGLFEIVLRRSVQARLWEIAWRPDTLSTSFHGRDLVAPVAARIATGGEVARATAAPEIVRRPDWPDDLAEIVYLDSYGNAMTGLRAATVAPDARLEAAGQTLDGAHTFSSVAPRQPFWYANANGLVEIAANQASAATVLGLAVGDPVRVVS